MERDQQINKNNPFFPVLIRIISALQKETLIDDGDLLLSFFTSIPVVLSGSCLVLSGMESEKAPWV